MKKIAKVLALLAAMAVLALAGCKGTVEPISVAVESVTFDTPTLTLKKGETKKLTATVKPDNADDKTVKWESSDKEVATVDQNGTVTAVNVGTATVTATAQAGGKTAKCEVTVSEKDEKPGDVAVEGVTLNTTTLKLTLSNPDTAKGTLTATVTPSNADDKTVKWESSDKTIATVDEDGNVTAVNVVTVTAKKVGTATITATTRDGGKTATCKVTVTCNHEYENRVCKYCKLEIPNWNDGMISDNGWLIKYTGTEKDVVIPEGVTAIGENVFKDNTTLTSVTIHEGVTSIGDNAFNSCSGLKSVTIPEGVTSIRDGAFRGCSGLKSVTIPDRVTSIGDCAFSGCSGLTSVEIPASVTSIGSEAFYGCESLTSVEIPASVTSIGDSAFYDCTSLKEVIYGGTEEQWAKIEKSWDLGTFKVQCTDGEVEVK